MRRFLWLALGLHPAWCQIFEGAEGDFIIPEGSCCQDHHGICILKNCCDFRFMLRHVWRAIRHRGSLQPGHGDCVGYAVEECCSVNRNYGPSQPTRGLPWYHHGLLTIKVHSRRSGTDHFLKVLQGTALNYWRDRLRDWSKPQRSRSFPTFDDAFELFKGAGLLWPAGYGLGDVLAQLHVELPLAGEVKFLDISAGTGLASLVALLRGWNVLSTDLLPESGQTRRMSAMASFGQNSSVLDRLQIAELDLLDASTWPSHTTPHAYHVIGGSSITHVRGKQSFEFAFRKLVAANLAPRGVGLYTFTFEAAEADRIRQTLTEFLENDQLKVFLFGRSDGQWFPLQMEDVRPRTVHLLVFGRNESRGFAAQRKVESKLGAKAARAKKEEGFRWSTPEWALEC